MSSHPNKPNTPPMPDTTNTAELREQVFGGKTLRQNLQDVVARNNTGYAYEELKEAIRSGEELLEDDETESVDKTVNLLTHLFFALLEKKEHEANIRVMEWRIEQWRQGKKYMLNDTWQPVFDRLCDELDSLIALTSQATAALQKEGN